MSGEKSKSRESLNHKDEEKVALKDAENDGDANQDEQLDSSKVQFINGGTTESRVDIEGKTHVSPEFTGLTKEELMKFADDPFWVKVRWILLILFWVAWVAMLAAAIAIIIVAPKCPPRPKQEWWQKSSIYSVFAKSFKDTDKNGYGDLEGIHQNLNHFQSLNATIVYLNAIYPSSGTNSYAINDFKAIDPIFGSMEEFETLKIALHKKGMKIVMDFIPNHSSKNHTWFQKSQAKEGIYADYYIWAAGSGGGAPNGLKNAYGESAWTYDDVRKEYYYHRFAADQPDLNLRDENVQKEMTDILSFWIDAGVDGFYVNDGAYLIESADIAGGASDESITSFQPETFELITTWRELLDASTDVDGKSKFLLVESAEATSNQSAQFYKYEDKPGAHMTVNKALLGIKEGCDARCVSGLVEKWMGDLGKSGLPTNWQTSNRDTSRLATRMNQETFTDAINMLVLTLPGTAITYYGEEIGMHDVPGADAGDALGRDPYRTPLQWTDAENAGFTEGTPWLPIAGDYKTRNIKTQRAHGSGVGRIEVYADVSKLRSEPSMQWGAFQSNIKDGVYYFTRQAEGFDGYLIAVNLGTTPSTVDFTGADMAVPANGKVVASTQNFGPSRQQDFAPETPIALSSVHLKSGEGFIATWAAADTPSSNSA